MPDDKSPVDSLKDTLYSRTNKHADMQDVRAPLEHQEQDVPKAWRAEDGTIPPRAPRQFVSTDASRMSFASRFFIISAGFFAVALAVAVVAFWWGPNTISPNNIDIQIVAPSLVDGGKEADFQIIINNKNPAELQVADLVIDYPDGSRDPKDPSQSLLHERQSLGTIAPASEIKRTAAAILYGSEGATQVVRATLEYSVAGSNAVFTRAGQTTITIGSAPVSVSINTPSEAIAGQAFAMDITVRSNATAPVTNVVLQGQLPFGYQLQKAEPAAGAGQVWRLGTMNPGTSQTIHLTGVIDGQDGDQRVFKFLVGQDADVTDANIKVPFLIMPATITVSRPFISGALTVNGQSAGKVSAQAGSRVEGTVTWQNNLSTAVTNVEVTLKLQGPMIDKSSINAGTGFYQSSTNSIVWTSDQDPSLASVAAGGSGQMTFSFGTLPPGQGGVVYTNPTATLSLSVAGERPGEGGVPQQVTAADTTQISFASQLSVAASAQYLSGPKPPVAESASVYSISWVVKNSSNSIGSATVSAVLPPYVTFVSGGQGISFDAASRTVSWQIGNVAAGAGYTQAALNNSFQVSVVPSSSQVGSAVPLTGAAALAGIDRFTNTQVSASAQAPTTVDNVLPKQ